MAALLSLSILLSATSHPLIVRGTATWYAAAGPGHAAAGPSLRRALGKHWRGQAVRVCRHWYCVRVKLTDWCKCGHGRVIDLSNEDFAKFRPLWYGVMQVNIRG